MLRSWQSLINLAMKYTKFHSVDGAAPIVVRKVGRHQDTVAIAASITIAHKAGTAEKAKLRSNLGRPNDQRSKRVKAYKITLLFIDFDEVGKDEAKYLIESARLPNHIHPGTVMSIEEADIGPWHDDHPLNKLTQMAQAFAQFFPDKPGQP